MNKKTFLTIFFQELNNNQIDYFVYGEYENLPNGNGNSDIDIMLSLEQFPKLFQILTTLLQIEKIPVVSYYENKVTSFVRILTPSWGIQFDFFGGIFHQGSSYYKVEYFKENIIKHNGFINVLSIKAGYYLDFLKETIHISSVKEKYINGFIQEYSNNPVRRKELCNLYGENFVNIIDENLQNSALKRVIPQLNKIMIATVHKNDFWNRLTLQIHNLKRCFSPPGYVIAVLGTDGSGKSTIINAITPILNEAFHHGVIYNHLRPNVIPELGVLLEKKEKTNKPTVVTDPHAQKSSGIVGSLLRWGYYLTDYTFGYLKSVFPVIHTKSKVFIFDRYYYDYYIDQRRARIHLPQWILRFGELFVPTPDLTLCLGGNPQDIYARKPETSLEEVIRQTEVLKEFCRKRKKAVWIDTTTTPEKSIQCTMNAICNMMSKRFENIKLK